ncbi:acyltransferase family protein [Pseudomonas yangonensis]|uniref:acyltransferase family protein n=1 Tax=Pseudomonas yangonensis TaxID=2579922 RepID=UPI00137A9760|nr:acyltransferase [Pseudomonas yangonensis]
MRTRIGDIEILRGVAVLMVVFHHAADNLFTWNTPSMELFYSYFSGWVGVDLFFAISGFVIARDLVPQLLAVPRGEATRRMVLAFWVRRAWRLLPSAWLWLLVMLIASLAFNQTGAFGSFRTNLEATVAGVLQVANFRLAEAFMQWPYGASFVYWSLSLEEQFYLLFPLLILLVRRYLLHVMILLVLFQFFLVRTPTLMFFRTDALALGVLLALWTQHSSYWLFKPNFLRRYKCGLVVVLVALLCLWGLGSDQLRSVNIRIGMIALVSAALVWVASYDRSYMGFPKPLSSLLIWLGARSYAIYLIHIPAFYFTRELWFRTKAATQGFNDDFFYPFVITACLLILVLSELNYRLLEVPLRDHGKRVAQRIRGGRDSVVDMPEPVRPQ